MLCIWIYVTQSGKEKQPKVIFNGGHRKLSLSDFKAYDNNGSAINSNKRTTIIYVKDDENYGPINDVFNLQKDMEENNWFRNSLKLPLTLEAHYVLNNPSFCSGNDVVYIVMVYSAVRHFMNRATIRHTWGNPNLFPLGKVMFLVGTTTNTQTQTHVEEEFTTYQDILQGPFVDSDKNLTHKGVMGFRWITEYCSQAKVVIKTDDEIVFNTKMFLDRFLPLFYRYPFLILGKILENNTMPIIRNNASTWYVPEDEPWFKGKTKFPKYMSGLWVGLSMKVVKDLYLAAFSTSFFWIDDVYLFGLLTRNMKNVTYAGIGHANPLNCDKAIACYNTGTYCPMLMVLCPGTNFTKVNLLWKAMRLQRDNPPLDIHTLVKPALQISK